MRFQITPAMRLPALNDGARQDSDISTGGTSLAAVRMQAEIAAEYLADLEAAVDARRRRGSWQPGAAISWHDFRELGYAEDTTRRRG